MDRRRKLLVGVAEELSYRSLSEHKNCVAQAAITEF